MKNFKRDFVKGQKISWMTSADDLQKRLSFWYTSNSLKVGEMPDRTILFGDLDRSIANRTSLLDVTVEDLEGAGVPKRYVWSLLEKFDGLASIESKFQINLGAWPFGINGFDSDRTILAIYGPPGTGKTHLATGVLRRCLGGGLTAAWLSVDSWLASIHAAIDSDRNESAGKSQAVLNFAYEPDLLVLDDLAVEHLGEAGRRHVSKLISKRHDDVKPILLTTNNPPEVLEDFDARVFSRIGANGLIGLGGRDRRRMKAKF